MVRGKSSVATFQNEMPFNVSTKKVDVVYMARKQAFTKDVD
jgi:hypothetical protein